MSAPLRYPRPSALAQLGPGHSVVESSAGTGKTFLLEHLFVDCIVNRGVSIDQILVVTFTEKATAELVLRLRRLLAELVDLGPDHARAKQAAGARPEESWIIDARAKQRLGQALLSFDRASISTIHGFCHQILREHAFVQGRLFDEGLVVEEVVNRRAFRELLRAHADGDGAVAEAVRAWLGSNKTIGQLEDLLCECAGKQAKEIRPRFVRDRLQKAVRAWPSLTVDEDRLTRQLKQAGIHPSTAKKCARSLVWLSQAVADHRDDPLALLGARCQRSDLVKVLDELEDDLAKAATNAEIARAATSVSALRAAAVPLEAALVHILLSPLRERAAADKRRAGTFDYADLLGLVGRALDEGSPVRDALLAALRRRYRVALIDEFQDTDETQWAIFRRIFVDGDDGHALAVIGDPKQAIYGFRGANVSAYLDARQALCAAGAGRLQLARNYRSTADLIRAHNLLFADEAAFFRPASGIRYDAPVTCGRPDRLLVAADPELAAPVVVLGLTSRERSPRTSELQAALQASIVAELRWLTGPSCSLRLRGRADGCEAVRARDIFVLTFTNDESRAMGQALSRAGIPFAFYKQGKLFESPEADEILAVLRAVNSPDNRSFRARALLTRFFDLDLAQAAACIDEDAVSEPVLRLRNWTAFAKRGDIPGLFASLVDHSGILRREVFANAGERALTNTMHVFEILQAEWARTHASLPELVALLAAYIRGSETLPGRDADLQRLETDKDAVQILTVHMAKGLEADVVFLYGGTGEPSGQSTQVFRHQGVWVLQVGKPDRAATQAADDERSDEHSRLLYVAFTRARYRLYVPHYPAEFKRLRGRYRQANHRLGQILGPDLSNPDPLFAVRTVDCAAPAQGAEPVPAAPAAEPVPPELLTEPTEPADLAPIRVRRSGFLVTSYSAVKRAHAGSQHERDTEVGTELGQRQRGTDELPGGAKAGIFLHEALAEVRLPDLAARPTWTDWFADPGVQALFDKLARRHGRPPGEVEPSGRLVHRAYTRDIRLGDVIIGGLATAAPALREMEFHFPIPARTHPLLSRTPNDVGTPPWKIERGVVRGFVDFLFEHGGRIYVCDWKSDTLPDYSAQALAPHCAQNYDVQAHIYTVAALRLCGISTAAEYERRFGGTFFCFLRGLGASEDSTGIHHAKPDWDAILAWEKEMLDPQFWGELR
jgi:exodeoxyribonuclease V beta subunit